MARANLNKDPDDVSKMFDGVANRYDFLNDLLSLGRTKAWRKVVTSIIGPKPGLKILDIAAGTGSSTRPLVDAGADGLALINTVLGMVINIDSMKPHLGGKTGGLSGPAIKPVAVRAIYQVHAALPKVPILGMGGVASGRDALELILAGASGVSVGTASFGNPKALIDIQNELRDLLAARGFATMQQAIGYAHRDEA